MCSFADAPASIARSTALQVYRGSPALVAQPMVPAAVSDFFSRLVSPLTNIFSSAEPAAASSTALQVFKDPSSFFQPMCSLADAPASIAGSTALQVYRGSSALVAQPMVPAAATDFFSRLVSPLTNIFSSAEPAAASSTALQVFRDPSSFFQPVCSLADAPASIARSTALQVYRGSPALVAQPMVPAAVSDFFSA